MLFMIKNIKFFSFFLFSYSARNSNRIFHRKKIFRETTRNKHFKRIPCQKEIFYPRLLRKGQILQNNNKT